MGKEISNTYTSINELIKINKSESFDSLSDNDILIVQNLIKQRSIVAKEMKNTFDDLDKEVTLKQMYDYINDNIKKLLNL